MTLATKKKVAEFIGYTVMPYNKFVHKYCAEPIYRFHDSVSMFVHDSDVGNPHGFVCQLAHWYPDKDWTHLMEVATFMVKEKIPVMILPSLTPEAAWKDIMKSLKKHLK